MLGECDGDHLAVEFGRGVDPDGGSGSGGDGLAQDVIRARRSEADHGDLARRRAGRRAGSVGNAQRDLEGSLVGG